MKILVTGTVRMIVYVGRERSFRPDLQTVDPHAGRSRDRVCNRRRRLDAWRLADALCAERTVTAGALYGYPFDARHIHGRRHLVVGEIGVEDVAVAIDNLLGQSLPQALGDATLDLAFDIGRINRKADVLRDDVTVDRDHAGAVIDRHADPHGLEVELTETHLLADFQRANEVLTELACPWC